MTQRLLIRANLLLAAVFVGFFLFLSAGRSEAGLIAGNVASLAPAISGETLVSVQPGDSQVYAGQPFTVSVSIAALGEPLNAFQFDLEYDSSILKLDGLEVGPLLRATGRNLICPEPTFPDEGLVRVACASSGRNPGPVSDGSLVELTFQAIAPGTSALNLVTVDLVGAGVPPASIDAGTLPAQVTVLSDKPAGALVYLPLIVRSGAGRVFSTNSEQPGRMNLQHDHYTSLVPRISDGGNRQPLGDCYPTDLDCDRYVDEADVSLVAGHWDCAAGDSCYGAGFDLDANDTIDVLDLAWVGNDFDVTAPRVSILVPGADQTFAAGDLAVSGVVTGAHAIVSVEVNEISATLEGNNFSASIPMTGGNQSLDVIAVDELGKRGLASSIVKIDAEGPEIRIEKPRNRQAIYTLTPTITLSYHDFLTTVELGTLQVQVVDSTGGVLDVTGDLLVGDAGASGRVAAALKENTSYTLTVTLEDAYGNPGFASTRFYVPPDPGAITPPEEADRTGWIAGVVFDSANCDQYLVDCRGLPGAAVTLSLAGGDTVTGTVITGPDGFFAFPIDETDTYWLRAEMEGYTYGQRSALVELDQSVATNNIYLTPIDPVVTLVSSTITETVVHTSSDGVLVLEIPPGSVPAGQVVTVTATNFRHVEFLPSGALPEGTWETYAFNLGGDSEITFIHPITLSMQNYRGFAPGTLIPMGYWNQKTMQWEHEGVGVVDPSGEWVTVQISRFSNHDINFPGGVPVAGQVEVEVEDETNDDESDCEAGEFGCFIGLRQGILREEIELPPVQVLGETEAPKLLYSSARTFPGKVIDVKYSQQVDPTVDASAYIGYELTIAGQQTPQYYISRPEENGEVGRFRYLWDGTDAQGSRLAPGVYPYSIQFYFPYTSQYCRPEGLIFGNPPDCDNFPTGVFVEATLGERVEGNVELGPEGDVALGEGWMLAGHQQLYRDDAGRVLISSDNRLDEFYFPERPDLGDEPILAWVNSDDDSLQSISESSARAWPNRLLNVGQNPEQVALSPDGRYAYVTNYADDTVSLVDLATNQEMAAIGVGKGPYDTDNPRGIAVSADGHWAYVTNESSNSLSIVDLQLWRQAAIIDLSWGTAHDVALSPDGHYAYVTHYNHYRVSKIDLDTHSEVAVFNVGYGPAGIDVSPDGQYVYVAQQSHFEPGRLTRLDTVTGDTVDYAVSDNARDVALSADGTHAYIICAGLATKAFSVVDLASGTEESVVDLGAIPSSLALSPDGMAAFITASSNDRDLLIQVDLSTLEISSLGAGGKGARGLAISPDGETACTANFDSHNLSVIDLNQNPVAAVPVGHSPNGLALSLDGRWAYVANYDDDTLNGVNLQTAGVVLTTTVGNQPYRVVLAREGNRALVANRWVDGILSIVDTVSGHELAAMEVGAYPQDIVLSPAGDVAYITHQFHSNVSIIDLNNQGKTGSIDAESYYPLGGLAILPDGETLLVTSEFYDQLAILDLVEGKQVGTIDVGETPKGIAVTRDGSTAYVAIYGDLFDASNDYVSIVDLANWQVTGQITVGDKPGKLALAPDGDYLYVANTGSHTISVVDLDAGKEIA
ncbi:MAG: beta-propeller fold lactonase family protein, partial [Anaerolineales bacterium]|nr:beta-propeller fold lactonase family protein [Anaerolineales bacterium]